MTPRPSSGRLIRAARPRRHPSIVAIPSRRGRSRVGWPKRPTGRHTVDVADRVERLLPWLLRLLWLLTGLAGSAALASSLPDDGGGPTVVRIVMGLAWLVGVAAVMYPAVATLTTARSLLPMSIPAAIATWVGGADDVDAVLFLTAAVATTLVAFTAELGRSYVQASAYGAEDRHLLRPPAAYLAAAVASWLLAATAMTVGVSMIASSTWAIGVPVTVAGAALAAWSVPRWHRLARRWLVVVPVGLVVHDHLVLAETLMLRRNEVARVALAPADTEAADLTGPAGGHAIEIRTATSVTAIRAGTPRQPGGQAIHLTACLVAPSRPGRALTAARRR